MSPEVKARKLLKQFDITIEEQERVDRAITANREIMTKLEEKNDELKTQKSVLRDCRNMLREEMVENLKTLPLSDPNYQAIRRILA